MLKKTHAKELSWKWYYYLAIIAILISLANAAYALKMAPGLSDESFYWYCIATQRTSHISFFSLYMRPFKNCSLFQLRAIMFLLISGTGAFFGAACYYYWKRKINLDWRDCMILVMLGIGAHAMPHPHFPICPSYITLNLIMGLLGGAFFVLSLYNNKTANNIYALLAGCAFSQLLFIMPSNCILLPVIGGVLLWVDYRKALAFAIGCLTGFAYFWIVLLPFNSWLESFKIAFSATINNSNLDKHGVGFLIKWTVKTLTDLFLKNTFIIVALIFAMKASIQSNKETFDKTSKNILVYATYLLFCLLTTVLSIKTVVSKCGGLPTLNINILYSLSIACVLYQLRGQNEKKDIALYISFLFCPFALTFGTDLGFAGRASVYSVFLLSIIFVLTQKEYKAIPCWVFSFIIFLCSIEGVLQFYGKAWTADEKLLHENTELYSYCGTKCSRERLELYNKACRFLEKTEYIYGDTFCWNFIMVLGKRPLSDNAFRMNENNLIKLLRDNPAALPKGVAVVESDSFSLDVETRKSLMGVCNIDITKCPSLKIGDRWNFIVLRN